MTIPLKLVLMGRTVALLVGFPMATLGQVSGGGGSMVPFIGLSSLCAFLAAFTAAQWLGPAWDRFARQRVNDITPRLRALGLDDTSVDVWLRWWGIAMFASFAVVGVLLNMLPVGIALTLVVYLAPRFLLDRMVEQRQIKLRDQLVRATVGIGNGCRAGMALAQSIEKVSIETPKPLGVELQRVVRYYKGGSPIKDALREVQHRLDLESFTIFSSSAIVSLEQGGNITKALEMISEGLQEMQRLERKLEADSASGRKLALMLGCFPIFFLLLFSVLDPVSTGLLYTTFIGNMILCLVGFIIFVAVKWCMAILDLDF
jgi:Flp pilus assembly protein TadB